MSDARRSRPAECERRQRDARGMATALRDIFASESEVRVAELQRECEKRDQEIATLEKLETELRGKVALLDSQLEVESTSEKAVTPQKFACNKCTGFAQRVRELQVQLSSMEQERARCIRLLSTADGDANRVAQRDFDNTLVMVQLIARKAAAEDREVKLQEHLQNAYTKLEQLQMERQNADEELYESGALQEYLQILTDRAVAVNEKQGTVKSTFCLEKPKPSHALPHHQELHFELRRACEAERKLSAVLTEQLEFLEERKEGAAKAKQLFDEVRAYLDSVQRPDGRDPLEGEDEERLSIDRRRTFGSLSARITDRPSLSGRRSTGFSVYLDHAVTAPAKTREGASFNPGSPKSPGQQGKEMREMAALIKQARDGINFIWTKLSRQSQAAAELLERANAVIETQRAKPGIESTLIAQSERFVTAMNTEKADVMRNILYGEPAVPGGVAYEEVKGPTVQPEELPPPAYAPSQDITPAEASFFESPDSPPTGARRVTFHESSLDEAY